MKFLFIFFLFFSSFSLFFKNFFFDLSNSILTSTPLVAKLILDNKKLKLKLLSQNKKFTSKLVNLKKNYKVKINSLKINHAKKIQSLKIKSNLKNSAKRTLTALPFIGITASLAFEEASYQDWKKLNPGKSRIDYLDSIKIEVESLVSDFNLPSFDFF
jgi:hypothetical protein